MRTVRGRGGTADSGDNGQDRIPGHQGDKFISGSWRGVWNVTRQCYSNDVATIDQLNQRVTGCDNNYGIDSFESRNHAKGTMNWYKPNFFVGNHDFKMGFDYAAAHADRKISSRDGSHSEQTGFPTQHVGNYELVFRNGVPFQMAAWNNCYKDGQPECVPKDLSTPPGCTRRTAGRWRPGNAQSRLRYAHAVDSSRSNARDRRRSPRNGGPAQCFPRIDFPTWNSLVPRVGVAFDFRGDGKSCSRPAGTLRHNWHSDELQMATRTCTCARSSPARQQRNKLFEPARSISIATGPTSSRPPVNAVRMGSPGRFQPVHQGRSSTSSNVSIGSSDSGSGDTLTGIYSHQPTFRVQNNLRPYGVYNIPITNRDPGPDNRLGTADDPGTLVTYWDYPAAYRGRSFQQPMLVNDSGADQNFKSYEVALSKRLSNRWLGMASYSSTNVDIPFAQNTASTGNDFTMPGLQVFLATLDPNAEINSALKYREWTARASGAYIFPFDIQLSANFESRSGTPYARTVSFTGGQQITSQVVRVEPIGTRQMPTINLLHVRGEKTFVVKGSQRVSLRANIYNFTNISTVQTLTQLSGPNFERPLTILPPRIVELGVNYSF